MSHRPHKNNTQEQHTRTTHTLVADFTKSKTCWLSSCCVCVCVCVCLFCFVVCLFVCSCFVRCRQSTRQRERERERESEKKREKTSEREEGRKKGRCDSVSETRDIAASAHHLKKRFFLHEQNKHQKNKTRKDD